jgi:nitronate monooxygenase
MNMTNKNDKTLITLGPIGLMNSNTKLISDKLREICTLLLAANERHWATRMSESLSLIENGNVMDGVEHLKSAYGGMGSFNDLPHLCFNGYPRGSAAEMQMNERLDSLKSQVYQLAEKILQQPGNQGQWPNTFRQQVRIRYPVICGAMNPCSNPELVAAVSEAGGIGIVQPEALVFAHRYDYREGLRRIRALTSNPIGVHLLGEKSAKRYEYQRIEWLNIALEEGVRFFITGGSPSWVIEKVRPLGGFVYQDVTSLNSAQKAVDHGIDGLICVNNRAGGHLGSESPETLFQELKKFNLPLICAGGVGSKAEFDQMMALGYEGVQLGTRFIASLECWTPQDYKKAIVKAKASDIVATTKIPGEPVSVIKTPNIENHGDKQDSSSKDFWQAGKSVETIDSILTVRDIIKKMVST